uniref:Transposase n=1 Tax=Heterorhabditis bacteriophora TaxID=37862 RepID=A0A1I7XRW0_HETBA
MMCTDNHPNFILGKSEERWIGEALSEPRHIGLAMVARQHVKRMMLLPIPTEIIERNEQEQ